MRFHKAFGFSFCRTRPTISCPANTTPTQNITSANTSNPATAIACSVSDHGKNGSTSSRSQGITDPIAKRIPNFATREKRLGEDIDVCRMRIVIITRRQSITFLNRCIPTRDRAEAQTLPFEPYEQDYCTATDMSHHTQSLNPAPESLTDSSTFFSID